MAEATSATPITREISRLDHAIDKVVISKSLTPDQMGHGQVAGLKQQTGKDMLMFGGRTL